MKKILALFLAALGIVCVSCSSKDENNDAANNNDQTNDQENNQKEETKDFSISKDKIELKSLGSYEEIVCKYGDDEVYDVTYTLSKEGVVEVINGVVIAKADGNTVLSVKYKDQEEFCTISVSTEFTTTINEEATVFNLNSGETKTISATVKYPNSYYADLGVTYSSSNEEVATVDKTGKITAVAQGIATITASSVVEITESMTAMGMTINSTSPATDTITVIVDNEYEEATHASLVGTYQGTYDWQGFAVDLSKTDPKWTNDNFKWIRAISKLTLNSDGTFSQMVLNAQRKGYNVDENAPGGDTYELQKAKYTKCYVYNSYGQKSTDFNVEGKVFADVIGYEEKGINNFAEIGAYAIFNGELVLVYNNKTKNLGAVENNAWLANAYEPFTNMVAMHANMTMVLSKVTE